MPIPARNLNTTKLAKFHEKAVRTEKIRYTASVIRKSFFLPYRSVR
jgi:hypothetical protein